MRRASSCLIVLIVAGALAGSAAVFGESVAVRHVEGIVHGFLSLRTLDGTLIADGDLVQLARGARVTTRLVFHFKDGSIHDETAIYSQGKVFKLLSDHLVQKGPTFPRPLDMSIDVMSGNIAVRYSDEHGRQKTESKHLDLPPDLANGVILTLLKNVRADAPPHMFSFVAATPTPQLVRLAITVVGQEPFSTDSVGRQAVHYNLKVDIGGLKGLIAPLVGKQPPDAHVWILGGDAPAFVKAEQTFYFGGPVWRIELTSPVWPRTSEAKR